MKSEKKPQVQKPWLLLPRPSGDWWLDGLKSLLVIAWSTHPAAITIPAIAW
jgi:hypothetical protein